MWHVYYDGPVPQLTVTAACSSDSDLLMSFRCIASGTPASLLVGTGASDAYVSIAFVQRCGFYVQPSQATITLADGTVTHVTGTCTVWLRLGQYSDLIRFHVADLSCDWDLILGQSWLKPHCAVIDYSSDTITFWKAQQQYKLESSHFTHDKEVPLKSLLLSVAQVKRAVKEGRRTFLVHVSTSPDLESTPPIHPDIQSVLDESLIDFLPAYSPTGIPCPKIGVLVMSFLCRTLLRNRHFGLPTASAPRNA